MKGFRSHHHPPSLDFFLAQHPKPSTNAEMLPAQPQNFIGSLADAGCGHPYSMTMSALASSVGGSESLSAFAVLRLRDNANLDA
jgi:hypothetical protein